MNLRTVVSIALSILAFYSCGNRGRVKPADSAKPISGNLTNADSLTRLEAIIKANPSGFEAWYQKGLLLAEMNDTLEAISALETSFSLQPLQTSGIALANLYAETKNERALALCNAMLKKDTARTLTEPVFIKGIYYTKSGEDALAIEAYNECIRRDWKFTEAYIEKGILLYNRQKLPEALKVFQLAATVTNTYADAYFWMGRCYEALGQKKEAAANYTKALALDKDFTEAAQALERINIL